MHPVLKKSMSLYLLLLYLVLLLAAVLAIFYFISEQNIFGILMLGAVFVLGMASVIGMLAFRRSIHDKIINDAAALANREFGTMQTWDAPYALFRKDGRVSWCNNAFEKLLTSKQKSGETVMLADVVGRFKMPEKGQDIHTETVIDDRTYRMTLTREEIANGRSRQISEVLYSVSLMDVTKERMLEIENANIQPVVALINIDNYDQVLASIEDRRRPVFEAMLYKRLNDLNSKVNGILTRMEKDRLMLIFPHEALARLKETRFQILDEVRNMKGGNRYQVTLSIGIGVADRLEKSMSLAQASIDLALGRGGDQVVLKDGEDTQFYGGKSQGVEKYTRVRARQLAYALRELIADADRILIMGHAKPDLDCFGASVGLARTLSLLDKEVYIVLNTDTGAISRMLDIYKESQEATTPLINAARARELSGEKTLLFVLDVNRPAIVDVPRLLEINRNVVVIDHHRTSVDSIADTVISYVEPYASSCSEMITELIQYIADRPGLRALEADAMLAGISLDTKNFTAQTGIRTFEAAAFLRRCGADSMRVRQLFKNDLEEYRYKAYIMSRAQMVNGNMAIAHWDGREVANAQILAASAADELLEMRDIEASFVLTQTENEILISARSSGDTNVQVILEKMGGGGHINMAGAQLKNMDMNEAVHLLNDKIHEYIYNS